MFKIFKIRILDLWLNPFRSSGFAPNRPITVGYANYTSVPERKIDLLLTVELLRIITKLADANAIIHNYIYYAKMRSFCIPKFLIILGRRKKLIILVE